MFSKKYFLLGKYFSEKLIFFGKKVMKKTAPTVGAVGFCLSINLISKEKVLLNNYLFSQN